MEKTILKKNNILRTTVNKAVFMLNGVKRLSFPFSSANPPECGQAERLGNPSFSERFRASRNDKLSGIYVAIYSCVLFICLFLLPGWVSVPACKAEVVRDWVVAFVDDEAITNSELQEQYRATLKITPDISKEEVLNTMINRILILREAKKNRLEGTSPEAVIKEYIDLRERAFIRVPEAEIEKYFKENSDMFYGKKYEDVLDEIEQYFIEKELNARLKETLRKLRKTAYIKILSKQGQ